ncbi:hypothetical protein SCAR479_12375 [Seiridium cardinale]|uniref:Zn(2)-C6 fungal-type domain-containing protein n=1 Tax=Seiridium cardinale TaxID=138064 RepID=A0ABR2XB16_9PEZI
MPAGIGADGMQIAPMSPWVHACYATTGKNALGEQINGGQQISRKEFLYLHTRTNQRSPKGPDEYLLGAIEVGRLGGIVVLNDDYFNVPDEQLKTINLDYPEQREHRPRPRSAMTPAGALPFDPVSNSEDEPPAKRLKTQACARCRRRKQKCDDQRPCANCQRSGEDCVEVVTRFAYNGNGYDSKFHDGQFCLTSTRVIGTPMPLAWAADLPSLEERVARLERAQFSETSHSGPSENGLTNGQQPENGHASSGSVEEAVRIPRPTVRPEWTGSLNRSSPAIGLLATFARSDGDYGGTVPLRSPISARDGSSQPQLGRKGDPEDPYGIPVIDRFSEDLLFDIYNKKIHSRYPFLRLRHLRDPLKRPNHDWVGYFLNMIYSISLLVGKNTDLRIPQEKHMAYHRLAVTRFLSHVFAQPDRLLHIQAYLLLAMHALYSPSTERIISIASATMRYCVMAQLHLADAEPETVDAETKVQVQIRRRVFWSAYALDRVVCTMFDLPFSIPDYQITVKVYANIDDSDLDARCGASFPNDPASQQSHTNVSAALHVVFCRQIQSEILNTTLHRDFAKELESQLNWRLRILEKLDRWKSLCHRYTDPRSRPDIGTDSEATKSEWLHMLYRPTKKNVDGPAGDWTVRSCVQACLIFRKFQKTTATMSEAWLAMIAQFKSGVALLYCLFAAPPDVKSPTYKESDVSEAVRACSIILSLLAERWPQSSCLRDTFDILAREIPTTDTIASSHILAHRRIRQESASALLANLPQLELIIVHRDTIRMIKEIATGERPTLAGHKTSPKNDVEVDGIHQGQDNDASSLHTTMTGDIFQPMTPHFWMPELNEPDSANFDYASLGFPGIFDDGSF